MLIGDVFSPARVTTRDAGNNLVRGGRAVAAAPSTGAGYSP